MVDHIAQLDHIDADDAVLASKTIVFDTNVHLVHVGLFLVADGEMEELIVFGRPVVGLGLCLLLAFLVAEMGPAHSALDKWLEHAFGTPFQGIRCHYFHCHLYIG